MKKIKKENSESFQKVKPYKDLPNIEEIDHNNLINLLAEQNSHILEQT